MKTLKAKEARALIGKFVEWDESNARSIITREGWVEAVKSRNIQISGDWKWLPDLEDLREVVPQPQVPSNCPECGGVREWTGMGKVAQCHFCGAAGSV